MKVGRLSLCHPGEVKDLSRASAFPANIGGNARLSVIESHS
jgi:hypothetical protein